MRHHFDDFRGMMLPVPFKNLTAEVAVIGAGPAGLTAAIALAMAGLDTILVGKQMTSGDNRTTALLHSSVTALDTLGVWEFCRLDAAPLRIIRLIDDMGRLLRLPEVQFVASEIGLDCFGYNIENRLLLAALERRARSLPTLNLARGEVETIDIGEQDVTATLDGASTIKARMIIGADGRHSICRTAAGIMVERHRYQQTALTLNIRHTRPHHHVSTEFHTETGPFTLVPLPEQRSSVVFSINPTDTPRFAAISDRDFGQEIEHRSHSILGKTEVEADWTMFPLALETATSLCGPRVVLIGEAAHVIPPIGAQGLNLGLRDAATIAELAAEAHHRGHDTGSSEVTERYNRMRRADVVSRTLMVDLLNRSLLSDFLPWQAARGLGLFLTHGIGPVRRAVMREGVMPAASQPRLMRGELL
jgi:2-octaprenyl-6-methoxyphenol hydroxylase